MSGGGAERQLTLLAGAQMRAEIDVHVALIRGGPNLARLKASGATLHQLRAAGNHDPRMALGLARLVHSIAPSIIQTWLTQMDVVGGLVAMVSRVPWVLSERASEPAYRARRKERVLRPLVGAHAGAVVANSEEGLTYWRRKVRPRTQLAVVPNCLSLEEIEATPPADLRHIGLGPERGIVLFAGRLVPQKNLPLLVSILARSLPAEDAVGLLCGEGPDRQWLEAAIQREGLSDRVRSLGYRSDLLSLMKRADVFLNPSTFEGQPNTVLEAMACGCPVIVSDIPEHRAFVDGSCAALVPLDSLDQWVAAVRAGLRQSGETRVRADQARRVARRYSPAATAEGYRVVYERLLSRAPVEGSGGPATARSLLSSARLR
jgi:glycosyltransferase involved in cell wall biosynthesis